MARIGGPDELIDALTAGDRIAERQLRDALRAAAGSTDAMAAYLDPLAASAADGSVPAVDLLVWAVDVLDLARPTIRRLLLDAATVDEVAQDVLIAVAEGIGRYRGEARFSTWLYQVSRNKSIDHVRRQRAPAEAGEMNDMGDAQRISSMIATRTSLKDVIESLDRPYRDAVVLRDIEHLSYEEIADRLAINLNTVRTRIARGRAQVAARMAIA